MTSTMTSTGTGCPCGCDKNPPGACELHSLVRPRFFCGQLLTDEDLAGLVTWAVDRRRLDRLRSGWGVVCGLDVGADPATPGRLTISPGHAVTSCGDDVVLPTPAPFDPSACLPEAESCATPGADPPSDTCVLDIGVKYRETGDDPVLALGRSACGQAGECENSRIVESYELVCRTAVDGTVPQRPEWTRWQAGLEDALSLLARAAQDGVPGTAESDPLRNWLANRLRESPPVHFPFVADWIRAEGDLTRARFLEALFWLTQDRMLSFLSSCPTACDDVPVWLGRVWLTRRTDPTPSWVVTAVDPGSPYRREFDPDSWPAPVGQLNIARVLWHRPDEACLELRKLGVPVDNMSPFDPARVSDVDELRQMFTNCLTVACDHTVCLRFVTPPEGSHLSDHRVVGFVCEPTAEKTTKRTRATTRVRPAPKPAIRRESS